MNMIVGNAIVKKANASKDGEKVFVTIGDKDAVKELDFSVEKCNVKAGYEGAVVLSGADIVFMRSGGFITGQSLDALSVAKK